MSDNEVKNIPLSEKSMGDVSTGRPNLGPDVPVWIYRLMQYTLKASLEKEFGAQKGNEILYNAGKIAGARFCELRIGRDLEFNDFISTLQRELRDNKIGILRVEKQNSEKMHFTVTIAEDIDCSGLPVTDETLCVYDEGFLAGIMSFYTGREFSAKEVDCWATGERICRFEVKAADEPD